MNKTDLARFKQAIGYAFRNKKLLESSLTHPSVQKESVPHPPHADFQRLEFLGDSVLNFFIAAKLYELFPKANEGFLSRLRSVLVSRKLLARIARTARLKSYLSLGLSFHKQPTRVREKILADSFESLIGAIYLDRGYSHTYRFLLRHFASYFNEKKLLQVDANPKSNLQEHVQKKWHILPVYSNQQKEKDWLISWVSVQGKMKTKGEGETKQEAETEAAAKLLKRLQKNGKTKKKSPRA